MTRPIDVAERYTQWSQAYEAVRRDITPDDMRTALTELKTLAGIEDLQAYMSLARNVMANDRTSAVVAAMLTATGIKPVQVGEVDEVG